MIVWSKIMILGQNDVFWLKRMIFDLNDDFYPIFFGVIDKLAITFIKHFQDNYVHFPKTNQDKKGAAVLFILRAAWTN